MTELLVRDAFGRIIERRTSFTVDLPLEALDEGAEFDLPDGTHIRLAPGGPEDTGASS